MFAGFELPLMKLPIFVRADYTVIEAEKTLKDVTLQAALEVVAKGPMTDRLESVEEVNKLPQRVVPSLMGRWLMDMEKKRPAEVLDQLQDVCAFVKSKQIHGKPLSTPWLIENAAHLDTILNFKKRRPADVKMAFNFAKSASGRTVFARLLRVFYVCFCYCVS